MPAKKSRLFLFIVFFGLLGVLEAQDGASQSGALELSFAGDIMAHDHNFKHKPYLRMYESLIPLLYSDDLTFGNLEFPVVEDKPYASYPNFNVKREYVQAAIEAGFDVFSMANNHSGDRGMSGIIASQESMKVLKTSNASAGRSIWFNGLRPANADPKKTKKDENFELSLIEVKGKKIGFVSVTEFINGNSTQTAVQMLSYPNETKFQTFLEWIESQRKELDLLVLSFHWGTEYSLTASNQQKMAAQRLVDAGVDILWGHHPHVLQAWYLLESKRGKALVMPSLGNFVSGQGWYINSSYLKRKEADRGDSALFKLKVEFDAQGKIQLNKIRPVLIHHRRMSDDSVAVFPYQQLLLASGDWGIYYRKRFEILTKHFPESYQASLFWDEELINKGRSLPQ